jgi:acyl carrier protein
MSTDIEFQLRERLLDVLGYEEVDEISPTASLVDDLGAESLDFVEALWVIEENFGVALKANELVSGQVDGSATELFRDDRLTSDGVAALEKQYPHRAGKIAPGMTKAELFRMITVRDLAVLISTKLGELASAGHGAS